MINHPHRWSHPQGWRHLHRWRYRHRRTAQVLRRLQRSRVPHADGRLAAVDGQKGDQLFFSEPRRRGALVHLHLAGPGARGSNHRHAARERLLGLPLWRAWGRAGAIGERHRRLVHVGDSGGAPVPPRRIARRELAADDRLTHDASEVDIRMEARILRVQARTGRRDAQLQDGSQVGAALLELG